MIVICLFFLVVVVAVTAIQQPWIHKSEKWIQNNNKWLVGANFIPSTAVNELQMFQPEDYDAVTIDRELGYAESLGFNAMRVFLHNLLWESDSQVFLNTLENFLQIAEKHNIGIMFVLLDSCWNAYPALGPQPAPIPYVHNSRWVQAPGIDIIQDSTKFSQLQSYITGVVTHFQNDSRIVAWDIWNEPDNSGYTPQLIAPLMTQVFEWCRSANPTQPLTTPLWVNGPYADFDSMNELIQIQISQSDIISFHQYGDLPSLQTITESLFGYDKPIVCTEYMARGANSYFNPNLGYMKDVNVSAFNWGLVSGLTQTIYPWDSWTVPYTSEPDPWFHDILLADGTPKYPDEADYIRTMTGVNFKK